MRKGFSEKKASFRRPANLSIDGELLDAAKELDVNVSRAAEAGIEEAVRKARGEKWLEENREALESSNEYVRKHGLPLAKYRMF
jgi:antitoxin CcdA